MRRWWLTLALLLSVGFNLGLLAAVAGGWWTAAREAGRSSAGAGGEAVVAGALQRSSESDTESQPASPPDSESASLPPGADAPRGKPVGVDGGSEPSATEVRTEVAGGDAGGAAASDGADSTGRGTSDRGAAAPGGPARADGTPLAGGGSGGDETAPPGSSQAAPGRGSGSAAVGPRAGDDLPPAGRRFGHGPHGFGGGGGVDGAGAHGPPLERMADHLQLAGETRQRFLALQRRFVADRVELQRDSTALTLRMHRELAADVPDEALVEDLIARRAELWRSHEELTARTILETRALLDAEQQQRYLHVLRRLAGGDGGAPGERPGDRLRGRRPFRRP